VFELGHVPYGIYFEAEPPDDYVSSTLIIVGYDAEQIAIGQKLHSGKCDPTNYGLRLHILNVELDCQPP